MSLTIISNIAFNPHIIVISILISYIAQWLKVAVCGSLWPLIHPLQPSNLVLSKSQCYLSPSTEPISLGLPPWICPPAHPQPFGLQPQVQGIFSLGYHTGSTWNCATVCNTHERDSLRCFQTSPMLNIVGFSCWTACSTLSKWVKYTATFSILLVAACNNFALKYWRVQWYHIQVLKYLWSLTLGLLDLNTKLGQLWLHKMTVLFPPSMSPLCNFASLSSL